MTRSGLSLRSYLLLGILLPVTLLVMANAASLYRQALAPPTPPTTAPCWRRPRSSANS
jgi:hypothetical protein